MVFQSSALLKTELHVHLDTCLSYHYLRMLNPELRLTEFNKTYKAPKRCKDLQDFLNCINPQLSVLQSTTAISLAVDDLFDQLCADNVIYAEIRFAPLLHLKGGLSAETVVEVVLDAIEKAKLRYGIEARLILCTLRHFSALESLQTAKLVIKYHEYGVVAIDLAADEARYDLDNHVNAFMAVREFGAGCIAHAGEAKGYESVNEVIDKLQVTRIGHGVRSIENEGTIHRLVENDILLEVCPSCNIVCNIFDSLGEHPVDRLWNKGVSISINTDARTVANTTLNEEYNILNNLFLWNWKDFERSNIQALKSSFIDDSTKIKLVNILISNRQKYGVVL